MGEMSLQSGTVAKNTIEMHCFLDLKWYLKQDLCHSVALHLKVTISIHFKVV